MLEVFLRTLPFFAIIGLGYWAAHIRFFTEEATAYLTRFVFYFALSAMLFRFAAELNLAEVLDWRLVGAYLWGTACGYGIAMIVAFLRGLDVPTAAVESQCAVIGNLGFLGIPMFVVLFGEAAIGPVMMMLAVDLVVFSSLIVILITGSHPGTSGWATIRTVGLGLLKNPMIMAITLGFVWSGLALPIPVPMAAFLDILGGAATPGALFAIGASLAGKSAERVPVAAWLTFGKLVMHPTLVAIGVLVLFPLDPFTATVAVSAAALPVAGNIYMLAQHYGVAPHRVSAAILFSTALSIVTVPIVISLVGPAG